MSPTSLKALQICQIESKLVVMLQNHVFFVIFISNKIRAQRNVPPSANTYENRLLVAIVVASVCMFALRFVNLYMNLQMFIQICMCIDTNP